MELRRGGKQLDIIEAIRDRLGVPDLLTRFSLGIYNEVIEMVESNEQWHEYLSTTGTTTIDCSGAVEPFNSWCKGLEGYKKIYLLNLEFYELLDSDSEAEITFYPTKNGFGCQVEFTWGIGPNGQYRVVLEYLGDFIDPIDMVATVGYILEEHPVEFYSILSEHQHIKIGTKLPEYWTVVEVSEIN